MFNILTKGFLNFVITSRKMSHLIKSSNNRSMKHVSDFIKAIKCDEQMTVSYIQGHTFSVLYILYIFI